MEKQDKRITSTVILTIFCLILLVLAVIFLPLDIQKEIDKIAQQGQNGDTGTQIGAGLSAGITGAILIIFSLIVHAATILISLISIIFSIRNRKASTKGIRIYNHVLTACFALCIISSIIKLIIIF